MQSAQVWVAGEALIDLLPNGESKLPVVGGGPANTAKALSHLGFPTSFIGGISSDEFGKLIEVELSSYGVDLGRALRSELPTAIAEVELSEVGSASYKFKLESTATFAFGDWLPEGNPEVIHIGTLATIIEPGASALFEWARGFSSPIVFDPNVRSSVLADREKYRKHFERWAEIASVVKLSEEDLSWLGYTVDEILYLGPKIVVLTRGAKGLSGYRASERIDVDGFAVEVVDTIGAGDTVGAVIVEGLINHGELEGDTLKSVLKRAAKAAAITCTRLGAKPPSISELTN